MPRFMRAGQAWEIELAGVYIHVIEGNAKTTRKFMSPAHALAQYDIAIAQKVGEGFVEVPDDTPPAPEEDAFDVPPDDLDALSVHADALQARGDPRGEIMALGIALERLGQQAAGHKKIVRQLSRLLARHGKLLFEDLAPYAVAHVEGEEPERRAALIATVRLGSLDAAAIKATTRVTLPDLYSGLRFLPAARHLRQLVCASPVPRGEMRESPLPYTGVLDAMKKRGAPERLASLRLGAVDERYYDQIELGDLDIVATAAPGLERLHLAGDGVRAGPTRFARLRELVLEGPCANAGGLVIVAATVTDALEVLVAKAATQYPTGVDEAVLSIPHLRGLRALVLNDFGGGDLAPLLRHPALPRLERLELACNDLGDAGALTIVDQAERFAHLATFDLRGNGISHDMVRRLHEALPKAKVYGQHDPRREARQERYEAIEE